MAFILFRKDETISPTDIQQDGSVPIDFLKLIDNADGDNGVILDAYIGALDADRTMTIDLETAPTDNQALAFDTASGRWQPQTLAGGGGAPSLPAASVQFYEGGAFGGDAEFVYDTSTKKVSITANGDSGLAIELTAQQLKQKDSDAGAGDDLTIAGSDANSGDTDGGDIVLAPGALSGAGAKGYIDASSSFIKNVLDPTADQDAATKKYADDNFEPADAAIQTHLADGTKHFLLLDQDGMDDDDDTKAPSQQSTKAYVDTAVTNSGNWDTAFGWGDHGSGGYAADADVLKKDGSVALTANWDAGAKDITNVANFQVDTLIDVADLRMADQNITQGDSNTTQNLTISAGDASSGDTDGGDIVLAPGALSGAGSKGYIDASTSFIKNVVDPVADQDAATKKYVDDNTISSESDPLSLHLDGGNNMAGNIAFDDGANRNISIDDVGTGTGNSLTISAGDSPDSAGGNLNLYAGDASSFGDVNIGVAARHVIVAKTASGIVELGSPTSGVLLVNSYAIWRKASPNQQHIKLDNGHTDLLQNTYIASGKNFLADSAGNSDIGSATKYFGDIYIGTGNSLKVNNTQVVSDQVAAIGLDAKTDAAKITDIIAALRSHGLLGPNA